MEDQDVEIVHIKVLDRRKGDVVFEGKVSADVTPDELVQLRCFCERQLTGIFIKATDEQLKSFKGLRNNVELVVGGRATYKLFSGVLYIGADGVVRKSKIIPSSECEMMSVWKLTHEECEKVFKCETLKELDINFGCLRQIPSGVGGMKKLRRLRLYALYDFCLLEEVGELASLETLDLYFCGVESLPKRLKEMRMLKSIALVNLNDLQLYEEDLVVFSKLKHLSIKLCSQLFTPSFTKAFWEMIKTTTDLCVLELNWRHQNREMVVAALEENGSIVDGGEYSDQYAHFFKRNKENRERALQCSVHVLALRKLRNVLNGVPKEMIKMIAVMLWNTRCDVKAWP